MFQVVECWARSAGGRPIQLNCSHPLAQIEGLSPLLFIGGIHGDEPEGFSLAREMIAWLKSHTPNTQHAWIIIPALNPDGEANNQRTNDNGVDLNRNFPSSDWSSDFSEARYCPGPNPGSEPEIEALVNLIKQTEPRLIVHFHSWKPGVVFAGPPNHPAPQLLAESSGYPIQTDIGYPTPGSLGQWGWLDQRIPIVCTEEAEGTSGQETWSRFGPGLKKIFEEEIPLVVK